MPPKYFLFSLDFILHKKIGNKTKASGGKNFLEATCSLKKLFTTMPPGVTFGHKEISVKQPTNSIYQL